ncbi:MAG: polyamine aminopropyltransferase [Pseudomonadota bacterium]
MAWFEETYYPRWRQRIQIEEVVHQERTAFQDLMIFQSIDFGRVLVLDGIVQLTERDEFIYHEMLSHVPLVAHGAPRDVLIIGGGDGGTLKEVLKHERVSSATMIELDPAVVTCCRTHMPSVGGAAFDDPRAEVLFADGIEFVSETDRLFDVIIVDSTDEIGPGEVLFSEAFYADCRARLRSGGVLVGQFGSGNPSDELEQLAQKQRRLGAAFADVGFYTATIPTYIGGTYIFGFASTDPAKRRVTVDQLATYPAPAGLRQYAPDVHAAAFVHPPWLAAAAFNRS